MSTINTRCESKVEEYFTFLRTRAQNTPLQFEITHAFKCTEIIKHPHVVGVLFLLPLTHFLTGESQEIRLFQARGCALPASFLLFPAVRRITSNRTLSTIRERSSRMPFSACCRNPDHNFIFANRHSANIFKIARAVSTHERMRSSDKRNVRAG